MLLATSGCFLYFHEGHRDLFRWLDMLSSSQDRIYIAINSGAYLLEKKQNKEPENMAQRLANVKTAVQEIFPLKDVYVAINDDIISDLKKNYPRQKVVWVVGDDYLDRDFKEKHIADCVVFTKRIGISSTKIEEEKDGREVPDSPSTSSD